MDRAIQLSLHHYGLHYNRLTFVVPIGGRYRKGFTCDASTRYALLQNHPPQLPIKSCLEVLYTILLHIIIFESVTPLCWPRKTRTTFENSPFVQAPRRFTILTCEPTWIKILSSDTRSLYSVSRAPSAMRNAREHVSGHVPISPTIIPYTTPLHST